MRDTQQRSIRLSRYHLNVVEKVQEEKGLNFTDAVKHIIFEFAGRVNAESSLNHIFKKLDAKISNIDSQNTNNSSFANDALFDELQMMGKNIHLILKALHILGTADSSTLTEIEDLFREEAD